MNPRDQIQNRLYLLKTEIDFFQALMALINTFPETQHLIQLKERYTIALTSYNALASLFEPYKTKPNEEKNSPNHFFQECHMLHEKLSILFNDLFFLLDHHKPTLPATYASVTAQITSKRNAVEIAKVQSDESKPCLAAQFRINQFQEKITALQNLLNKLLQFITNRKKNYYHELAQVEMLEEKGGYQLAVMPHDDKDLKPDTIYMKVGLRHFGREMCRSEDMLEYAVLNTEHKRVTGSITKYCYLDAGKTHPDVLRFSNSLIQLLENFRHVKDPSLLMPYISVILLLLEEHVHKKLPLFLNEYSTSLTSLGEEIHRYFSPREEAKEGVSIHEDIATIEHFVEHAPDLVTMYAYPKDLRYSQQDYLMIEMFDKDSKVATEPLVEMYPTPLAFQSYDNDSKYVMAVGVCAHELVHVAAWNSNAQLAFRIEHRIKPFQYLYLLKAARASADGKADYQLTAVENINPLYQPLFKLLFTQDSPCGWIVEVLNQLIKDHLPPDSPDAKMSHTVLADTSSDAKLMPSYGTAGLFGTRNKIHVSEFIIDDTIRSLETVHLRIRQFEMKTTADRKLFFHILADVVSYSPHMQVKMKQDEKQEVARLRQTHLNRTLPHELIRLTAQHAIEMPLVTRLLHEHIQSLGSVRKPIEEPRGP